MFRGRLLSGRKCSRSSHNLDVRRLGPPCRSKSRSDKDGAAAASNFFGFPCKEGYKNSAEVAAMKQLFLLGFALIAFQGGCEYGQNDKAKQAAATPVTPQPTTPIRRFVLVTRAPGVAFDTQTGQLCRTWDWQVTGKEPPLDPTTGGFPQRQLGEFSPTCLSVYQQYPTLSARSPQIVNDLDSSN